MPFDGVDLLPALTGESELAADHPLFFRRRTVVAWKGQNAIRQSAVRQGDWKYVRTYKPRGTDRYQSALYNLSEDIAEESNLAASNPEKMKAMSDLIDQWESEMSKTAIPFEPSTPAKRKRK